MTINWDPLWEIIQNHQRFVLSSHVRPDADALGSELAMADLLEGLGKDVKIINPSAAPDNLAFLGCAERVQKIGDGATEKDVLNTEVHLILDTSAWTQLLGVGDVLKKSKAVKAVIDHHVSSDDLGAVEFKDTNSEATGALIFQFAQACNLEIQPETAKALYCAIATDTGWFRFPSTTSETMRTIGALIDLGAEPHLIYQELYEQRSVARIKLTGRVLSRIALSEDKRIAYITVAWKDFVETKAKPVDTEDLVNECLKVSGVECAFIAIEQQSRKIKVSLRSRTTQNVAKVAEQFGGGGHKQAAGAVLKGPLEEATKQVLKATQDALI